MIKVLELFGGIGACTQAFRNLGIIIEIADYVEIDKYAVASYNAINNTHFEPQDITKWDKNIEVDILTHGSPCQDFSVAGKGAGGDEGTGTRSSLMYETIRIVDKLKPKFVIWENVKNLLSKKHKHNFDNYIEEMNNLGYNSYYQVLNAKDYGVPQNRERVFTVSIRKDIDKGFKYPTPEELKVKLKDLLEEKVDEKYYLSEQMRNYILAVDENFNDNKFAGRVNDCKLNKSPSYAITVRGAGGNQRGSLSNFICGNGEEEIKVKDFKKMLRVKNAYLRDFGSRGKLQDKEYCDTMTASMGTGGGNVPIVEKDMRIRKLTPKECWRLMSFSDETFEKAALVNSDTQLYKQAGNSIVVKVLEKIIWKLYMEYVDFL